MIKDYFVLALKNILHRKRRSWLTIIGILIGIAAVVALFSMGQGLNDSISREFEKVGGDKLFIQPGSGMAGGFGATSSKLTDEDIDVIDRVRGVDETAGFVYRSAQVKYRDESKFTYVMGIPMDKKELAVEAMIIEMDDGRLIRQTDTSNVMVGPTLREELFEKEVAMRSKLTIKDREYRVVGSYEATGDPGNDRAVAMTLDSAREIFELEDEVQMVVVRVQNGFDPVDVKESIQEALRNHRNVEEGEEDFTVSTPEDILASFQTILGIVQIVTIGIASISLVVGGVGIMNTMYTSVSERTREIGVMKALGATDSQILSIFLIESGLIGIVGGGIGVLLGVGMSQAASIYATSVANFEFQATLSFNLIAGSLLFSFVVGMLSGAFPARTAAKMNPADALRYE